MIISVYRYKVNSAEKKSPALAGHAWRRERDLRRHAVPSPFRETRRVRIPLSSKKPCVSKAHMAEREGFEDFSKSGNVEKSRKE